MSSENQQRFPLYEVNSRAQIDMLVYIVLYCFSYTPLIHWLLLNFEG
jgi:hypothetical protein